MYFHITCIVVRELGEEFLDELFQDFLLILNILELHYTINSYVIIFTYLVHSWELCIWENMSEISKIMSSKKCPWTYSPPSDFFPWHIWERFFISLGYILMNANFWILPFMTSNVVFFLSVKQFTNKFIVFFKLDKTFSFISLAS